MASELCHHQNHLPDRLRGDGCGADDRAWMMSSRELPTTMYRSWVWCAECSSLDVCGTLWTNLLPRTKNKATIEVFAGQPNEESDWETTTYCPSTRLVSRSSSKKEAMLPFLLADRNQSVVPPHPVPTIYRRFLEKSTRSSYRNACGMFRIFALCLARASAKFKR